MWWRLKSLVLKELLVILRDPRGRYILIVPPILQMLIFSFAATQEVKNVRLGVVNEDYGTAARDLLARFEGSRHFSHILHLSGEPEIAPAIDSKSVLLVIHIGPDFSRKLAAGTRAEVQLILDGRRSNAAQIVAGYAQAIVDGYAHELSTARRGLEPPSTIAARVWFNPNLETTWNTVPSLVAILTTLMGLVVTALSVARERELGTFEQLLVSPLRPVEIVIGKAIPALLIGLAEGTLMLSVGVFGFRVPFQGSIVLLYMSMTVYLICGHWCWTLYLVAGHDPAAGHSGGLRLHGPCHPPLGLRDPHREHAGVASARHADQPCALLPGPDQGPFSQGHAGRHGLPPPLAPGLDRRRDPLGRHLAVPPSNRVNAAWPAPRVALVKHRACLSHNPGLAGFSGSWYALAPWALTFLLNTLSPQVA